MTRILILSAVLFACGASAKSVNGPDGEPGWYSISCKRSRSNCIEKAGDVCPGGYETADSSEQHGVAANFGNQGGFVAPTYDGSMLIKCR